MMPSDGEDDRRSPALAGRLARRDGGAEANLQADVQKLLLYGGLNLDETDLNVELEAPVGGGRLT